MYSFVSLEVISSFLLKYGIDISLFLPYELSVIVFLANILVLLFYWFMFYFIYKIIHKIYSWWF